MTTDLFTLCSSSACVFTEISSSTINHSCHQSIHSTRTISCHTSFIIRDRTVSSSSSTYSGSASASSQPPSQRSAPALHLDIQAINSTFNSSSSSIPLSTSPDHLDQGDKFKRKAKMTAPSPNAKTMEETTAKGSETFGVSSSSVHRCPVLLPYYYF